MSPLVPAGRGARWAAWLLLVTACGSTPEVAAPTGASTALASATPLTTATTSSSSPATPDAPRTLALRRAIDAAAGYLVAACTPSGRFVYLADVDPSVVPASKYNLLRHAGAMYALASYQQRWPRVEVAAALGRAARYLEEHVAPVKRQPELSAVWSRAGEVAKLGGSGLALVALSSMMVAQPGVLDAARLRPLGAFIGFMQKPDGSFYSKYFAADGPSDAWVSLYYPGEAALGLLLLGRHDPAPQWHATAVRALRYLALSRAGQSEVPSDHWALVASAELLTGGGEGPSVPRQTASLVREHGRQICESILAARHPHPQQSPLHGCFDAQGYTTPTATRLEGLLSALTFLPPQDSELRARIEVAVDEGIRFLLRTQIAAGPLLGAMPRAHPSSRAKRRGEVRIDYPQHALSAWLLQLVRLRSQRNMAGRSSQ